MREVVNPIKENKICKVNIFNNNDSQNLDMLIPPNSPFPQAKRKGTVSEKDKETSKQLLTEGWLDEIFTHMRETSPGHLQLLNWRYKALNKEEHLCLNVADGTAVTKHVLVDEELEDLIKSTRLYSILEITKATMIDGCMLGL